LVRDFIMFSARHMKRYNPISISGYHISEAGANAVQEASFVLANAFEYVQQVTRAGMPVDEFAPRLSFFWTAQADFFEEIAKFRAARRVYAKVMRNRFGAQHPDSLRLRFHAQTAAITLTRTQPHNNLVRTGIQALAAVLGGAQSLHTNGFDESYALPSEFAATLALRTQQIIAEETNVASVVDPLGGSYFVEALTSEMEKRIVAMLGEIEAQGGVIPATENGWFQRSIADTAYEFLKRKESGARTVVGVNKYVAAESEPEIPLHESNAEMEQRQITRLRAFKARRDSSRLPPLFAQLKREALQPDANLMPVTIALVQAHATLGEIVEALREVWGTHREGMEV
jgi:methylmalonyl-CoA mutase N-terminal domain/subunit